MNILKLLLILIVTSCTLPLKPCNCLPLIDQKIYSSVVQVKTQIDIETINLFTNEVKKIHVEGAGSGSIIKVGNNSFVLTANHVCNGTVT